MTNLPIAVIKEFERRFGWPVDKSSRNTETYTVHVAADDLSAAKDMTEEQIEALVSRLLTGLQRSIRKKKLDKASNAR